MARRNVKVTRVKDGDTFKIDQKIRKTDWVRIAGVDTPEKGQAGFRKAKEFTKRQIEDKPVTLDIKGKDKYGRLMANMYNPQGKSIGKKLKRQGWEA